MLLDASLDTSFWNYAVRTGVVPYLFSYFQVHYPEAVEREIVTTDPDETPLIYPQAMLFNVLKEDGRLFVCNPTKPLNLYGRGEAHAIALAYEKGWTLLINDVRPLIFAQSLGVTCVSVPDFCLFLYSQGKITYPTVHGCLKRLQPNTSPKLIQKASSLVEKIALLRGDIHDSRD
jgi:predicted nucleic acid-binding protein